jgi:hypothetical protein
MRSAHSAGPVADPQPSEDVFQRAICWYVTSTYLLAGLRPDPSRLRWNRVLHQATAQELHVCPGHPFRQPTAITSVTFHEPEVEVEAHRHQHVGDDLEFASGVTREFATQLCDANAH